MDQINAIAMGEQRTIRKIADLVVDQPYVIEAVRKVATVYGDKIVLDLANNEYLYLPARLNTLMLKDEEAWYNEFQQNLTTGSKSIVRLPGKLGRSWPIQFINTPVDGNV